nr:MAG TPA: hypothetical protein [Caudoviricetes sp.]
MTQRASFQQWFMASIFNQNSAVLQRFLFYALLLLRHKNNVLSTPRRCIKWI